MLNNNNLKPNRNSENNSDESNCWVDPRSPMCESIVDSSLEFANLKRYRVKDDGNCLFYTVELWIRLNNYDGRDICGNQLINLTSKELRKNTVDHGLNNLHLVSDYFTRNNNNNNNLKTAKHLQKVSNALMNMRSNKQWAGEGGDYMPLLLSYYTGLNLIIYNWSWNEPFEGSFIKLLIDINPGAPTVNILRINDNHFDLLIPITNVNNETNAKYDFLRKYSGKPLPKSKNKSTKKTTLANNGKSMPRRTTRSRKSPPQ